MRNYKRLLIYIKPYLGRFGLAIICIIIASGANLYLPWIIKDMIDNNFGQYSGRLRDSRLFLLLAIVFGVIYRAKSRCRRARGHVSQISANADGLFR